MDEFPCHSTPLTFPLCIFPKTKRSETNFIKELTEVTTITLFVRL